MSSSIDKTGVGAYMNALQNMPTQAQKDVALKAYNDIKDYKGYVKVDLKNPRAQLTKMGSALQTMEAGARHLLGVGKDIADTQVLKKVLAGRLEQLGVAVPPDAPKQEKTAVKAHDTAKAQVVPKKGQEKPSSEATCKALVADGDFRLGQGKQVYQHLLDHPKDKYVHYDLAKKEVRSLSPTEFLTASMGRGGPNVFLAKDLKTALDNEKNWEMDFKAMKPTQKAAPASKVAPRNLAKEAAARLVGSGSTRSVMSLDQFLKVNPSTYVRYTSMNVQNKFSVLSATERATESASRLTGKGDRNVYEAKFLREAVDARMKSIPDEDKRAFLMQKPSGEQVNRMEARATERADTIAERVKKYPQAVQDYRYMLGNMGDKYIPGLAEQFKNYTGTFVRINPKEADDVKPLSTFEAAKEIALRAAGRGSPNVIDAKLFKEVLEERMSEVSQEGFEAYEDMKPAVAAEKSKGGGIFGRKKPGDVEMDIAAAHPKRAGALKEEEYMELKGHVDTADVMKKREETFKKRELFGADKGSSQFENVDKSKNRSDVTARSFKPKTGTSEDLFGDKEPASAESLPGVGRSSGRSDVRQMDEKSRMTVKRETFSASKWENSIDKAREKKVTAPVFSEPRASEGIATRFSFQVKDVKKPKVMHKVECKIHLDGDAKTVKSGENLQTNFMKHVKEHLAKDIVALPADITPQGQVDAGKELIAGYRKLVEESVLGGGLITGQVVLELPNGRTLTLNLNKNHTISETATPLGSVDL